MAARANSEEAHKALDAAKGALEKHEADQPNSTTPVEGAAMTTSKTTEA